MKTTIESNTFIISDMNPKQSAKTLSMISITKKVNKK